MAVIVVVDDDADYRTALSRYLTLHGHHVHGAPNGHEAIALLTSKVPALVILDAIMPKMDGITFAEVVRSYLRWQDLPIIMITAYPEGIHIQRARELRVTKTFFKGTLDFETLVVYVNSLTPSSRRGPSEELPRLSDGQGRA